MNPNMLCATFFLLSPLFAATQSNPISVKEASGLIDQWVEAQNQNDFKRYGDLYSPSFLGIKRSGKTTRAMNRARWLSDREKMFAKKMEVTAFNIQVTTGAQQALIHFEQRWESPTYTDQGPKEIILIRDEGGDLKIGREEMLQSQILHRTSPFHSSVYLNFQPYGPVLLEETLPSWASGPAQLDPSTGQAYRKVVESSLPSEIQQLKGQTLLFYGETNEIQCERAVMGFRLIAPTAGGFSPYIPEGTPDSVRDATVAKARWEAGSRRVSPYLIAEIDPSRGCEKAVFAVPKGRKAPTVIAPVTNDALRKEAIAQFHKLAEFGVSQKAYQQVGASRLWDENSAAQRSIRSFPTQDGHLIAIEATAGEVADDGFYTALTAIWEKRGTRWKRLVTTERLYNIHSAADLNGDGTPELLYGPISGVGGSSVGFLAGPDYTDDHSAEVIWIGCGH